MLVIKCFNIFQKISILNKTMLLIWHSLMKKKNDVENWLWNFQILIYDFQIESHRSGFFNRQLPNVLTLMYQFCSNEKVLFYHSIKPSFDTEVAEKFLNVIYYICTYMLESVQKKFLWKSAIFHSIKLPFDTEVAEKFLNVI